MAITFGFFFQQDNPFMKKVIEEKGISFYLNLAKHVEELGYTILYQPDHFMLPKNVTLYDCWTLLSAIACMTEKIKLASLVNPLTFFPPFMVAKKVLTVDHISKGRAILGAGCGWYRREYEAYDIKFDELKVRAEKLEEALKLILALWIEKGKINFDGKYYKLKEAEFEPKPIQKPHIPIFIGGASKFMLKLASELANGWIPYETPFDELERKIKLLKRYLSHKNRDVNFTFALATKLLIAKNHEDLESLMAYTGLKKEYISPLGLKSRIILGKVKDVIKDLEELVRIGVNHLSISPQPPERMKEGLELFSKEVIPCF
ncbi:MAG: LLM class flavin-dependent oxidoreductase [Nitrososphaerales archaeon]